MPTIILTQTDTTVGFLSQSDTKLYEIKSRKSSKPFIKVYSSFKNLQHRVPPLKKNLVRRATKSTFVLKNRAFRVAKNSLHSQYLRDLKWSFSTSANESNREFHRDFCEKNSDIIVEDKNGLFESESSTLYKINNFKIRRLR